MSSQRLHVDVVSAEEQIFSGEAEFAVFPGVQGEIGVYPRHTPLLTHLKSGTIRLKLPDRKTPELVYVSGGTTFDTTIKIRLGGCHGDA